MFRIENPFAYTKKIIYDLEFSGDLRDNNGINCCIWQVAARDFDSGKTFSRLVNPYLRHAKVPRPVDDRYKMPTREEFQEQGLDVEQVFQELRDFLDGCMASKPGNLCLMSHNGFRSDKVILENTLMRYNLMHIFEGMPLFFFDTLYYFRTIYPGLSSYSLASLYMNKFKKEIKDAHDAIVDVSILEDLLKQASADVFGVIYPLFATPFTNVSGVGSFTEQSLASYGFISLDHFLACFQYDYKSVRRFLLQTPLRDRADLLAKRLLRYVTSELNQRMPRLLQQRSESIPEKSSEPAGLVCS